MQQSGTSSAKALKKLILTVASATKLSVYLIYGKYFTINMQKIPL